MAACVDVDAAPANRKRCASAVECVRDELWRQDIAGCAERDSEDDGCEDTTAAPNFTPEVSEFMALEEGGWENITNCVIRSVIRDPHVVISSEPLRSRRHSFDPAAVFFRFISDRFLCEVTDSIRYGLMQQVGRGRHPLPPNKN